MNSDHMSSSDPSKSPAETTANEGNITPEAVTPAPSTPTNITETATDTQSEAAVTESETLANRQQPIPPPSEPMQYRAIGLVRGRYSASTEQFTQGTMVTSDNSQIQAVLLGRIMSLVKNHLDLDQEHLWVVYPRTGQETGELHLQIVGVWEPEKLAKSPTAEAEEPDDATTTPTPSTELEDGYFSVRGEVVYQSFDAKHLVIKIKQAPRSDTDKPKYFKLKLEGVLTTKAVGQFWDIHAKREADKLLIQQGESIATLPKKPKPRGSGKFVGKPRRGGTGKPYPPRRNGDTQRPIRKTGDSAPPAPRPSGPKPPAPKPVKRQKPPEE